MDDVVEIGITGFGQVGQGLNAAIDHGDVGVTGDEVGHGVGFL